jgi:hypothetical protein
MRAAFHSMLLLILAVAAEKARAVVKSCLGVDVQSIEETARMIGDVQLGSRQVTMESRISAENQVTVIARGPILGSMDSRETSTEVTCTEDGFTLTAVITRSANYTGAVRQNVLWVPTLSIVVVPRQHPVTVHVVWKLKLSGGPELRRARTPPYPEQRYPIRVTHTIASGSASIMPRIGWNALRLPRDQLTHQGSMTLYSWCS